METSLLNRQDAKYAKEKKIKSTATAKAQRRKGKQKQNEIRDSEVLCGFSSRLCGYCFSLRFLCDLCASAVIVFDLCCSWRLGG
jgi:hypothetical protein